ncbi:MAG: DUF4340 domain-containing protein [Planctomycetes bacterium]|nr:DUF4340 domain-containing protein [Planctomycetota bacterium]
MNPRTLILLVLLLAGLGGLAWWQSRREAVAPPVGEFALLEGFDRGRVKSLRVDQFTYSLQMELRVDADGVWRMVDPIDFPADDAVVGWLLDALSQNKATAVVDPDPKGLGFQPPRAVVEVREDVGGRERVHRIELGQPDLDGQHLFVRVDGRIVRTLGNLDNVLDRPRDLWRAKEILAFDPRGVVEFSRRGKLGNPDGSEAHDLELNAVLGASGWSAVKPFEGTLDPTRVLDWLQLLRDVRVKAFVDEASGRPDVVGLDQVDLAFEIAELSGKRTVLSFHRDRKSTAWYAMRSDTPYVWKIDPIAIDELSLPTEAFVDRQFVRVPKGDIDQVHLVVGDAELWLERFEQRWIVWDGPESGRASSSPADPAAAELLIGKLATLNFVQHVTSLPFESDDARSGLWLRAGGAPFGGRIGRETRTPEGGEGHLFRRDGESLVFLLDPGAMALARTTRAELESRQVLRLRELDLVLASVAGAGQLRKYVRSPKGRWSPDGVDQEAKEFALLVDRLIGLRAERWLGESDGGALVEPIAVTFTDGFGNVTPFTLGRLGERSVAEFAGRRAEVDAGLHAEVAKLLAP